MLPGPQQKLASDFFNKPGTQSILNALPVDSATKTRVAGEVFSALGGGAPDTSQEDSQSYSNTPVKTAGKYAQQGMLSASTGGVGTGYTG